MHPTEDTGVLFVINEPRSDNNLVPPEVRSRIRDMQQNDYEKDVKGKLTRAL